MKYKKYITEAKKASNNELINAIDKDGIGRTITDYVDWKDIEDPKLKKIWKQAFESITAIERYLYN